MRNVCAEDCCEDFYFVCALLDPIQMMEKKKRSCVAGCLYAVLKERLSH